MCCVPRAAVEHHLNIVKTELVLLDILLDFLKSNWKPYLSFWKAKGLQLKKEQQFFIMSKKHLSILQFCHNSVTFNLSFSLYVRSLQTPVQNNCSPNQCGHLIFRKSVSFTKQTSRFTAVPVVYSLEAVSDIWLYNLLKCAIFVQYVGRKTIDTAFHDAKQFIVCFTTTERCCCPLKEQKQP